MLQIEDGGVMDDSGRSCDMCGTTFQTESEVVECRYSHKTPTSLHCDQCDLYFANAAQMGTHVVLFHSIEDEGDEEIEGEEDIDGVEDNDDDDDVYEDSD